MTIATLLGQIQAYKAEVIKASTTLEPIPAFVDFFPEAAEDDYLLEMDERLNQHLTDEDRNAGDMIKILESHSFLSNFLRGYRLRYRGRMSYLSRTTTTDKEESDTEYGRVSQQFGGIGLISNEELIEKGGL